MGYFFLAIILLFYTLFLIYKERFFFFKKNKELLLLIQQLEPKKSFNNIWCTLSSSKIITSSFFAKVFFIPNGIIVIEDYSLDLNTNSKKYANTFLVTNHNLNINKYLFRNLSYIQKITLLENGIIKISTKNYQQSIFKSIGFLNSSYNVTIKLNLTQAQYEIKKILEEMNLN